MFEIQLHWQAHQFVLPFLPFKSSMYGKETKSQKIAL